jgi:hypothetical protein
MLIPCSYPNLPTDDEQLDADEDRTKYTAAFSVVFGTHWT